jgi:signal transduction histidine kinase
MLADAAGAASGKGGAVAGARRIDPSLATRMVGACAVLALFVAGVFAVEQVAVSSLREATRALARSRDVGRASLTLEAGVLDLENGVRGYVISGNPVLLRPWRHARVTLPGKLVALERSVRADPAQRARVSELAGEIASYQQDYALPLIAIARTSPSAARTPVATAEGQGRIDVIRERFARLLAVEDARASASAATARARAHRALVFGIGGLGLAVALVLLLGLYLVHSIGRPIRAVAAAATRVAGGDLAARLVAGGPGEIAELTGAFNSMAGSLEQNRRELEAQNQLLSERDRLKTELVNIVAHELRTPLTSILGFTDTLLRRMPDEQDRQRYLEIIDEQARRLASLVNDFLDLQRIEEGGLEFRQELIDMVGLLREQEALFAVHSPLHTLTFRLPPGHTLPVRGDPGRLAQVISNLLSNAIKYSPKGGEVELSGEGGGDTVRVRVRDHGIGIPAEQQARIFTKFFRGDAAERGIPGTGLGLTLAREIIEGHGGRIGFDSTTDRGSTFWIELPKATRISSPT